MIKKVDVTIVCKAEKDNVFDGFDDEKLIKILDESAGKVNNECCKVSIQPNLKWQKLKEWVKLQIDGLNEQLCDYDFDSDCREISIENFEIMLQQMQELEGEDVED